MQRKDHDGIIISCDFCGTDWDEVRPMIEGHKGSILCLECLKQAITLALPVTEDFQCTMCLRKLNSSITRWAHPNPPPAPGLNPKATVCSDCIQQAATRFSKDPDTEFQWKKR